MINPPQWPHAIENVSDKTVAISNRMLKAGDVGGGFMNTEEDYEINRWEHNMVTIFTVLSEVEYRSGLFGD